MLKINATSESFGIQYLKAGVALNYDQWDTDEDATVYASILSEFVVNGLAVVQGSLLELSYDAVYNLTTYERNALSIPELYPYIIYIQPKGLLKDKSFQYVVAYRESKLGRRFNVNRNGGIISTGETKYLLSRQQFELVEAIDEFNALPFDSKTFNGNLIEFARLRELSQQSKVLLDKYLQKENVFVPEKLKIEIEQSGDDSYDLIATIDTPCSDQFVSYLESRSEVPDNIALGDDDNNRTRVILDEEKQVIIQKIKRNYRGLSARRIREVVENPALFIDADQCDISTFYSDRVIEIGLYKPKVYPFISPYKSSWIPEYEVKDRINGTSHLKFETLEQLDSFESELNRAKAAGECSISYNDVVLNVEDGYKVAEDARKRLSEHFEKDKADKKVLIVEENAESLGYSIDISGSLYLENFSFQSIPGLKPVIGLKHHQIEGVEWLQKLILSKKRGCLLADDMGLGKTLQLLSAIDWYDKSFPESNKPYLIVAPVSLIENWEQEYEKFFAKPRIPICSMTGNKLSRHFGKGIDRSLIDFLQQRQIVITNYETVRTFQFSFCAVDYSIIILDEAQKIKTPGALVTNAAKALKGDFKVAMTGTPVENTLVDLWCIMDFALPGLLGNCKEFSRKYQSPLKSPDADIVKMGNEIRHEMGDYFLRRLKSDVARDLPNKYIERVPMEMPEIQRKCYCEVISNTLAEKDKIHKEKGYMLRCIQQLREISDHPYLSKNWEDLSSNELVNSSAKMKAIIPIVNAIRLRDEKVIMFAERRETQLMLKCIIRFYYQLDPHVINGDTPTIKNEKFKNGKMSRQQAIDDFQSRVGFNVIIMSPIAAGMGLNIVGANNVIHYSRHWNPAKEDQATDRVYRIGQTKDVHVFYPMAIMEGITSFDQTLDALLQQKTRLAEATLFPTVKTEVNSEELFDRLFTGYQSV